MKRFRTGLILLALIAVVVASLRIFGIEQRRSDLQEDIIELSRIKYGLFSVDEWKSILTDIIAKKIEEFDFEEGDRAEMRVKITELLYTVLDGFEETFYEENSRGLGGLFRSSVAGLTDMFGTMKRQVPEFTEQILDFMDNPSNREGVRRYLMDKISDYTDNTFAAIDYTLYNHVIDKYHRDDRAGTIVEIKDLLTNNHERIRQYAIVLLVLIVIIGAFLILTKKLTNAEYLLLTLFCMCLLAIGITLPMIDIDARISEMNFTLLGEPVSFHDQVLFYKSKSILEVTHLMLTQGKADLLAVGILIFSFSVLFPFLKLSSSILYVYRQAARRSKIVQFFVFKTGKWSMADVMVVAIFMAFIGFSGIVSEQLRQFQNFASNLDIVATNHSNLQLGFYLFTSFAVLSLLVAQRLQSEFAGNFSTISNKS